MRCLRQVVHAARAPIAIAIFASLIAWSVSLAVAQSDAIDLDALAASLPDPREDPFGYGEKGRELCALRGRADRDRLFAHMKRLIENNSMFACMSDPDAALSRIFDWEPIDALSDRCLMELSLVEGPDVTEYLWRYFQTAAGFEDRRDKAADCRKAIQAEFFGESPGWGKPRPMTTYDVLKFLEVQRDLLFAKWPNPEAPYGENKFSRDIYDKFVNAGANPEKRLGDRRPLPSPFVAGWAMCDIQKYFGRSIRGEISKEEELASQIQIFLGNSTVWDFSDRVILELFARDRGRWHADGRYRSWSGMTLGTPSVPCGKRLDVGRDLLRHVDQVVRNSDQIRANRHAQHINMIVPLAQKTFWDRLPQWCDKPGDDVEKGRLQLAESAIEGLSKLGTPESCEAVGKIASSDGDGESAIELAGFAKFQFEECMKTKNRREQDFKISKSNDKILNVGEGP